MCLTSFRPRPRPRPRPSPWPLVARSPRASESLDGRARGKERERERKREGEERTTESTHSARSFARSLTRSVFCHILSYVYAETYTHVFVFSEISDRAILARPITRTCAGITPAFTITQDFDRPRLRFASPLVLLESPSRDGRSPSSQCVSLRPGEFPRSLSEERLACFARSFAHSVRRNPPANAVLVARVFVIQKYIPCLPLFLSVSNVFPAVSVILPQDFERSHLRLS